MASTKPWVLVVPGSRGIGHQLTRALLRRTSLPILATARSDPEATKSALLRDLPETSSSGDTPYSRRLHVAHLDVKDEGSVAAAAKHCDDTLFPRQTHHLHLAFALPGVLHVEKRAEAVDLDAALDSFRVNSLGPLVLMKHFAPFLPRRRWESASSESLPELDLPAHAVWASMSARVGSTTDNKLGGWFSYRASKAAVMSLTRSFDLQLAARGGEKGGPAAVAMAYHPGTVRTDFTKGYQEGRKLLEPDFAADRMLDVLLSGAPEKMRGKCWDWKGEEVPP